MSKRNTQLLVEDILESCHKIMEYTNGISFKEFVADSKTIDAVVRNFEIIGEAANRLPEEFKDLHQDIDWFRIRGFRNRIVHDDFGIDYSIVWQVKETYLPQLIINLEKIT
ncbi:MAG: DUF86 domain-containing protein [Bacteroidales bacterium]|nr:DUF86 domain-containing protein [Bacteroidales bacterium]